VTSNLKSSNVAVSNTVSENYCVVLGQSDPDALNPITSLAFSITTLAN
jgi:hypothetical protein